MKKTFSFLLTCIAIMISTTAFAVDVKVNDTRIIFDEQPRIIEGHAMVPMRAIFEVLLPCAAMMF